MWAEVYGIRPWDMHRLDWREAELIIEDLQAKQRQQQHRRG